MATHHAIRAGWRRLMVIAIPLIGLAACTGGGDEEAEDEFEPYLSAGGVWRGSMTPSGGPSRPLAGLITEEGDVALGVQSADGAFFFGQGDISGDDRVEATATAFARSTAPFPDGSTRATATFRGTFLTGSSISGTYSVGGETGTYLLTYDAIYDRPSSLATLSGVYTLVTPPGQPTASLAISANGEFTMSFSTGCTANGRFRVVDGDFNAYKASLTFGNCGAPLDGAWDQIAYLRDPPGGGARDSQLVTYAAARNSSTAAVSLWTR